MKLMLCSDWHLRYKAPSSRTDDIFETQCSKVSFVLETAKEMGCSAIIQAGDLLDNPKPPNILLALYIRLFRYYGVGFPGIPFYCVLGQHDLSMHNLGSLVRSGVDVLQAAEVLKVLSVDPVQIGDVWLYGASWEQEIPKASSGTRNVLVLHKMIGDQPLYPGHDPIRPKSFLHTYKGYELILCGDYHYPFVSEEKGRTIVNTGCLTRQTCSDRDLQLHPACCVYDTVDRSVTRIEIPHEPSDKIFVMPEKGPDKPNNKDTIQMFVDRLRGQLGITVSFRDNLNRFFTEHSTRSEVREEIELAVEEAS